MPKAKGKKPRLVKLPFRCHNCDAIHLVEVDLATPSKCTTSVAVCQNYGTPAVMTRIFRSEKNLRREGLL